MKMRGVGKSVAPYSMEAARRIPLDPVATFPTHLARRISSQRSCFTIHGRRKNGLARFALGNKPLAQKIIVPGYAGQNIKRELKDYGIDETTNSTIELSAAFISIYC